MRVSTEALSRSAGERATTTAGTATAKGIRIRRLVSKGFMQFFPSDNARGEADIPESGRE
jgi:hypothetical protein